MRARRSSTRRRRAKRALRPRTYPWSVDFVYSGGGRKPAAPREEDQIAQKEEKVEMTGEIVEALRNGMFRIKLDNGHETLGYTAGKMRRFRIRMNPGDRVRIELSAYDCRSGSWTLPSWPRTSGNAAPFSVTKIAGGV